MTAISGRPPLENEHSTKSPHVIHVVDDNPSFRSAISRLLKVSGYEVADYESATLFLLASETARPGCILLDVQMPTLGVSSFRKRWQNCLSVGPLSS